MYAVCYLSVAQRTKINYVSLSIIYTAYDENIFHLLVTLHVLTECSTTLYFKAETSVAETSVAETSAYPLSLPLLLSLSLIKSQLKVERPKKIPFLLELLSLEYLYCNHFFLGGRRHQHKRRAAWLDKSSVC